MKKSLAQEFNETSAAADAAFPDKLGNMIILLTPSAGTPVYVSPQIAHKLSNSVAEVKKIIQSLEEDMLMKGWAGINYPRYEIAGVNVGLIALKKEQRIFFSRGNTKEMWSIFVLDHELGHRLLRNGSYSTASSVQHAESAADAYAMLRHIQRYGKDTNFAGNYGRRRSSRVVLFGKTTHYSKFTMNKVIEAARKTDVSSLSLQETAELAAQIADDTHLDAGLRMKLETAYRPVAIACKSRIGGADTLLTKFYKKDPGAYDVFCRETLAVMRARKYDADVFALGKEFLTSFPAVKKFMQDKAKTDAYWQEALDFISNPEKKAPVVQYSTVYRTVSSKGAW